MAFANSESNMNGGWMRNAPFLPSQYLGLFRWHLYGISSWKLCDPGSFL